MLRTLQVHEAAALSHARQEGVLRSGERLLARSYSSLARSVHNFVITKSVHGLFVHLSARSCLGASDHSKNRQSLHLSL